MNREYSIIKALKPAFPTVPNSVFYTDDESIIGAEFYVMDRVDGHMIVSIPDEWDWTETQSRKLCENFFQKLVDLHAVDYKAIGLENFGRPVGYTERQIKGWNRRFEAVWTDDVGQFEDVREWLDQNIPPDSGAASILHGDYRIDNCILDIKDPTQIEAIIDWEICALGDPLMDLGNTLAYWVEAGDPELLQITARQPSNIPGMMTRQDVLQFYSDRTGLDVSDFRFYYVYGLWRLAVILQQIYYRYYHGQTDNPRFLTFKAMVNALGETARIKIKDGII